MSTKSTAPAVHAFSALTASADSAYITKQTQFRGETITLYALPFLPASPFNPVAHDYRAGLNFIYNAAEMVAAYAAAGRKLPLDIEHNTEGHGRDTRARGWIEELSNAELEPEAGFKPGVLYAWCRLTKLGESEMLADELYGYTSAVCAGHWLDEDTVQLTLPRSLALTNNPASPVPSAQAFSATLSPFDSSSYTSHLQLTTENDEMLKELLTVLKLPADATADTALTAVKTLADKTASIELSAVQLELAAANQALAALRAERAAAAIEAAVDAAINKGMGTPADREVLTLAAKADLAKFSALVESRPAVLAASSTAATAARAATSATVALTAEDLEWCQRNDVTPEAFAAKRQALADAYTS